MASANNYWMRRATSTYRRRGVVLGAATLGTGAAALGLVGCGDDDDKPSPTAAQASGTNATGGSTAAAGSPAAGQPKRGGTIKSGVSTTFTDVMDPHTSLSQGGVFWSYIGNLAMRPSIDATKLDPELVEKYEIPSDGTEINLTIRQGVTWHNKPPTNGRAFTTDDLAFNLTRITGKLNPEKVAQFQRASTLPNFESATAVDDRVVKVKLTKPHSGFLYGMSDWRNSIVPRDYVEKGGNFAEPATMIGTGAWIIDSFQNPVKASFKANPNYWQQGQPYATDLQWIFYADPLSAQSAFAKSDFDFIGGGSIIQNEAIKKLNSNVREESWAFGDWENVRFNCTRKPFDDPRVRLAFHRVMDYKNWADSYYGAGKWDYTGPLGAAWPEGIPSDQIMKMAGWNPDTKANDIKAGKEMLSAAGFPDGQGLSFKMMPYTSPSAYFDNAIRAIDNLKSAFPKIQIDVDQPADAAVFSRRQATSDFDVLTYLLYPAADSVIEMTNNDYSTGSRNYGKFKDPEIDQLIDKASTQLDSKARADSLKQAQMLLIDKHMPTLTWSMPRIVTYFLPRLKGMEKYGSRTGGGTYDTYFNLRHAWLEA